MCIMSAQGEITSHIRGDPFTASHPENPRSNYSCSAFYASGCVWEVSQLPSIQNHRRRPNTVPCNNSPPERQMALIMCVRVKWRLVNRRLIEKRRIRIPFFCCF